MRNMVSTFPFYRWGNWGQEASVKLLVSERDPFFGEHIYLHSVNFVENALSIWNVVGGKSISVILLKRKPKVKDVT